MVVVGVTGHRFLAEVDKLRAAVDRALQGITERFPGEALQVLSSLAEGADRLVADEATRRYRARLVVPLPLSRDDYRRDFSTLESQNEFDRLLGLAAEVVEPFPSIAREEGYRAASAFVLDGSDILLAVWDGRPPQGAGGTASVVAEARARKLPLIWVHAGNRVPGTNEPMSLGDEQGKLTWENF